MRLNENGNGIPPHAGGFSGNGIPRQCRGLDGNGMPRNAEYAARDTPELPVKSFTMKSYPQSFPHFFGPQNRSKRP